MSPVALEEWWHENNSILSYSSRSYAKRILSHHTIFPGQPVKGGIEPADIWIIKCVGSISSRKSTSSIHTISPLLLWVLWRLLESSLTASPALPYTTGSRKSFCHSVVRSMVGQQSQRGTHRHVRSPPSDAEEWAWYGLCRVRCFRLQGVSHTTTKRKANEYYDVQPLLHFSFHVPLRNRLFLLATSPQTALPSSPGCIVWRTDATTAVAADDTAERRDSCYQQKGKS